MSEFEKWKNIVGALAVIGFLFIGAVIANAMLFPETTNSSNSIALGKAIEGTGNDSLTDEQNGITVTVSPKVISPSQAVFSVAMDNHSISLDEDLTRTTILVDATGKKYSPTTWNGSPPGGHHRSGELLFSGVGTNGPITLVFTNVGGAAQRTFTWSNV